MFFEGPPTANGRPGIHHFLGRAFKDLFCRYKVMRGFFVLRKAGWDTHGLPVEIEIEKELGFKNKKDIEDYGIGKFNKKAKESVWKYKSEWEEMTRKMGFWLDLKNPYITYQNDYIESLWHIIQQIWKKKLLYLAHKVVPFCTRCGTSLSSHEVAQGYKTITDRSVIVKFPISPDSLSRIADPRLRSNRDNFQFPNKFQVPKNSKLYILAWTTTPWTLPGNVALAVGKDIDYVLAEVGAEYFIVAKDLVEKVFGGATSYKLQATSYKGSDLVGLEYEPLFGIKELKSRNSYKVYDADFVSTEEGTGVVHTAVMYGEDDYNLGTKLELPKFHTVDELGKFVGVSKELDGKYVKSKEAENLIIRQLEIRNLLLKVKDFEHDYPFCWRCDSPLLYYAKSSWFIKMSAVKDDLLKNNQKINWFPEHIKEGRFGQWLKEGKDWAFSRERYWGTPLPIWKCQKCDSYKVIGSVAEMEKFSTVASAKKNNYYILRHSHTSRDEKEKMIISSELKLDKYHLTPEGRKQIEKNAELIKNNHGIDLIYSSPFIRTTETAEIVAKLLHLKIHKDDKLGEIYHGGCDGKPHSSCPMKDTRKDFEDKVHETGESWNDVRRRMFDFMSDMEGKYSGKNILIVSHGDPLWLLNGIAAGARADEFMEDTDGKKYAYAGLGYFSKLLWKRIPRNEYGELDLHRPFIDDVYLKCSDCGASMKKILDLIDVWFDSGAMPFAQWHWPFKDQKSKSKEQKLETENSGKMFKEQFPADFIVEGIDQTRGWFYTMLAVSTLLGKGTPYKNVMSLGHVLDEKSKKMSKSKGNVVSPFEVMDKVGADAARWYFYTINQPGEYKNFVLKDVEGKLKGFIFTLQNCVRFYELYRAEGDTIHPELTEESHLLDKWVVSKLNGLIAEVSDALDKYDPTTAARAIEKFTVEDLSNWWLRRSRKRKEAMGLLRFLLIELSKVISPFTPFIAEDIYRRLNQKSNIKNQNESESIHLADWPKSDKKLVNKKLEEEMEEVRSVVASGLALRKEKQMKVRQPLAKLTLLQIPNPKSQIPSELLDLVKEELNIKEIAYSSKQEQKVMLDIELSQVLINEGYARELIRQIQDMRKEAKYKLNEKIFGQWHSDDGELSSAIHEWADEIKKDALLKEFVSGPAGKRAYNVEKEFEVSPGKKIWVGVRK
ncbi:MAG: hypothetical protein A3H54_04810 [Candidatus Yanofskybacteria bacterium RIFCSPLOWO2_02_FULL_41_13]|nr:MAG: hypothetical protein A3H54_04810 [Candidatus Yanofskybacteria bacterium RIFCSPLOWO2_02_FULL_41_13]